MEKIYAPPNASLGISSTIGRKGYYAHNSLDDRIDHDEKDQLEEFRREGRYKHKDFEGNVTVSEKLKPNYRRMFYNPADPKDIDLRWKAYLLSKHPRGTGKPDGARIGTKLHAFELDEDCQDEGEDGSMGVSASYFHYEVFICLFYYVGIFTFASLPSTTSLATPLQPYDYPQSSHNIGNFQTHLMNRALLSRLISLVNTYLLSQTQCCPSANRTADPSFNS